MLRPKYDSNNPTAAMKQLMDVYGEDVKRYIFMYVGVHNQIDTIFQQVLFEVYKKMRRGELLEEHAIYYEARKQCQKFLHTPIYKQLIKKQQEPMNLNEFQQYVAGINERYVTSFSTCPLKNVN